MRGPRLRRLAFLTLGTAFACGTSSTPDPGPLDAFYKPSGLAVHGGKLLVASSNFDLRYALEDGGTIVSVDPRASANPADAKLVSGVRIASYTGELAVADAADCGAAGLTESVAVVASRSTTELFPVAIGTDGALRCDGCAVPLASGSFADPLAVGVACTAGFARAYAGHLRSSDGRGWVSELDLVGRSLRSALVASGPVRGLAFDRERERLWIAALSIGGPSTLSWIDLAGGCRIDVAPADGGCAVGTVPTDDLPVGLELRSIALSNAASSLRPDVRRAYVTGRLYDAPAAQVSGGRTTDYGGILLAVDLAENATGGIDATWTELARLGTEAADVRILPPRPGKRDVVAALDATALTIYDDETGAARTFGTDASTGAPVLGRVPWGIAVDPQPAGNVARLYAGSFQESFVTPIDVPLDSPADACIVSTAGACVDATAPTAGRIQGGRP